MDDTTVLRLFFQLVTAINQKNQNEINNIPTLIDGLDFIVILDLYKIFIDTDKIPQSELKNQVIENISRVLKDKFWKEILEICKQNISSIMEKTSIDILISGLSKKEIITIINQQSSPEARQFIICSWENKEFKKIKRKTQ